MTEQSKRRRRKSPLVMVAFLALAVVLIFLVVNKYRQSQTPVPAQQPPVAQPTGIRLITLFFLEQNGDSLVREGREIEACEDTADCVESVVEQIINGPVGGLTPTLSPHTTLPDVRIEGDLAVLDFDESFPDGVLSGSAAEMGAAYSLVNSISVNFPQIKRVQFLIGGKSVDTLKGHLDLRQPLSPDLSLEKADIPPNASPQR